MTTRNNASSLPLMRRKIVHKRTLFQRFKESYSFLEDKDGPIFISRPRTIGMKNQAYRQEGPNNNEYQTLKLIKTGRNIIANRNSED